MEATGAEMTRQIDIIEAHLDAARIAAEAQADTMRTRLLSGAALRAATRAVARMERIDGPDPNGYVRFRASDYAREAITAAISEAWYRLGEATEPARSGCADLVAAERARGDRLRAAYLRAEARIVAVAEAQAIGSLSSRVAGIRAQRDARRDLLPGDIDTPEVRS